MRYRAVHLIAVLLTCWALKVEAQGYPVQQAAGLGYKEFDKLWAVIGPLQNKSWPAKDVGALSAAAPDVQSAILPLADITYKTHNAFKYKAFKDALAVLTQTTAAYADAARNSDTVAVLQLFSQLHDQIEQTATTLLPIPWPEFERVSAVAEKLSSKARKETDNNAVLDKELIGIGVAMDAFAASNVPEQVQYRAKLIGEEQAYFIKLVARMKDSLAGGDMAKFQTLATELAVRLGTFLRMYLQ